MCFPYLFTSFSYASFLVSLIFLHRLYMCLRDGILPVLIWNVQYWCSIDVVYRFHTTLVMT